MKWHFNVERRNPTLWLIPTMYVMAKGPREYLRESYSHITYAEKHRLDVNRQLLAGTISNNRTAMPTLIGLMTPNVYDEAMYDGRILSPFCIHNKRFYRYRETQHSDSTTRLDFQPKLYNTQLLNGYAIVDSSNGHIIRTVLNGEFDMISFRTEIVQTPVEWPLPTPKQCTTAATFRFLGNRVSVVTQSDYNVAPLPDSIQQVQSRQLMDSLRPIPLSESDKRVYARYDEDNKPDTLQSDSLPKKKGNLLKKIFWDTIGETLITPIEKESEQVYFSVSPILNPLYVSYSDNQGLAYKMSLGFQYIFSPHRYINLDPWFGYNFRIKQFFFNIPLRVVYNPKRNGYAEMVFANGNRSGNASVMNAIAAEHHDSAEYKNENLTKFNDTYFRVFNNIMIFDGFDVESGFVLHHRDAVRKDVMRQYGLPTYYRSVAFMLGLNIRPWRTGPLLCIDWERSFRGVAKANIDYERWEIDTQWKHRIPGLRILNLRAGAGWYSQKKENYFLDYENFRKTNLPEGWNDNWSGDFQLMDDDAFNESVYYIRANASYESPLMVATWIPYLGKYIEKERFYINAVLLERSRPYYEVGYGFSNRYISAGAFASFKNARFQRAGFKFEIELFRRW